MSSENNSQIYSEINDQPDVVVGFGSSQMQTNDSEGSRNSYLIPVTHSENQTGNLPKHAPVSLCAQFEHKSNAAEKEDDHFKGKQENIDKKDGPRRLIILLLLGLFVGLIVGISAGIGIGWAIKGPTDQPDDRQNHLTTTEPSSTTSLTMSAKDMKPNAGSTTAEYLPNPILTIDNITYEVFINSQYLSLMDAQEGCMKNSNASLAYFNSDQQQNLFVTHSKTRVLPDLLQQRLVWEFWINHKTNVVPENSIAYNQLNNSGIHCAILTTWNWNIRQDLYLVTKPCSGAEWRNTICIL